MTKVSLFWSVLLVLICSTSAVNASSTQNDENLPKITNAQYEKIIKSEKPIFLSFNADWCPVCQKQNKALNKISKEFYNKAEFHSVDWDKVDEFVGPKTKQRSTIAYVKNNKIIDQLIGETDTDKIKAFIEKYTN